MFEHKLGALSIKAFAKFTSVNLNTKLIFINILDTNHAMIKVVLLAQFYNLPSRLPVAQSKRLRPKVLNYTFVSNINYGNVVYQ